MYNISSPETYKYNWVCCVLRTATLLDFALLYFALRKLRDNPEPRTMPRNPDLGRPGAYRPPISPRYPPIYKYTYIHII